MKGTRLLRSSALSRSALSHSARSHSALRPSASSSLVPQTFRGFVTRASTLQPLGRSKSNLRIRPAVGDQVGGLTESKTKESDSDWIKVQDYVKTLSPRILDEAHSALDRPQWKGEGVVQESFEDPCVEKVSGLSVLCTSDAVRADLSVALALLAGSEVEELSDLESRVSLSGLTVSLSSVHQWVSKVRNMRKFPPFARLSGLEFGVFESSVERSASQMLSDRGIKFSDTKHSLVCSGEEVGAVESRGSNFSLAMTKSMDVIPPTLSILKDPSGSSLKAVEGLRAKEIVVGAAWEQHPAAERFVDRLLGTQSRVSHGLWKLAEGPMLRLIPTDDTGIKSLVLYAPDAEAALAKLKDVGLKPQSFPGYSSIQVGGLDLRISDSEKVDSFYAEVRWEVADEELQGAGEGQVIRVLPMAMSILPFKWHGHCFAFQVVLGLSTRHSTGVMHRGNNTWDLQGWLLWRPVPQALPALSAGFSGDMSALLGAA